MIKKRYIMIALIFMAFIGLQMAQTSTAARLIDHGSYKNGYYKEYWKTYQYTSNNILVKDKKYIKGKLVETVTISIKKIKKNLARIVITERGDTGHGGCLYKSYYIDREYKYMRTSLNARQLYFKKIKYWYYLY